MVPRCHLCMQYLDIQYYLSFQILSFQFMNHPHTSPPNNYVNMSWCERNSLGLQKSSAFIIWQPTSSSPEHTASVAANRHMWYWLFQYLLRKNMFFLHFPKCLSALYLTTNHVNPFRELSKPRINWPCWPRACWHVTSYFIKNVFGKTI